MKNSKKLIMIMLAAVLITGSFALTIFRGGSETKSTFSFFEESGHKCISFEKDDYEKLPANSGYIVEKREKTKLLAKEDKYGTLFSKRPKYYIYGYENDKARGIILCQLSAKENKKETTMQEEFFGLYVKKGYELPKLCSENIEKIRVIKYDKDNIMTMMKEITDEKEISAYLEKYNSGKFLNYKNCIIADFKDSYFSYILSY